MTTNYKINLPTFAGPLDLLLHLIERQELDIVAISLAEVTEQYLQQVEQMKQNRMEQLIDFLVVAARLLLIKSRALLPQTPVIIEGEEEEDPAEALVRQLREYKKYKAAAKWLKQREEAGLRTYLRIAPPPKMESRLDMSGVTVDGLITAVKAALARSESRDDSVSIIQPRRITIDGQMKKLRHRVQNGRSLQFKELLSANSNRIEISITLLAILELIKRHEIIVEQPIMFGPINILTNNQQPATSN